MYLNKIVRVIMKIAFSTLLLFIAVVILQGIKVGLGTKYSTGGIGPFIVYPAIYVGLRAIWKWNPDKKESITNADSEVLKKD